MRPLTDSKRERARYADILDSFPQASVYHTPAWLRVWEDLGAGIEFLSLDSETMIPFVCRGAGALRRAYSLPFDTYGGPVTARSAGPVSFEGIIERVASPSVRLADFGAAVASTNGALRPMVTHIVDLSAGHTGACAGYSDANRRNIRQARESGVRVEAVSQHAALRTFHALHARTARRYGARALPAAFFESVFARLVPQDAATFYLAFHGDRVVGGNLVLRHRDRSYDWMWSYDDRFGALRATNLMIDRAVQDEAARGSREINLGASPDDRLGSVRFKQSFGAKQFQYAVYTHTAPIVAAARRVRSGVDRIGARLRIHAQ